METKIVSKPFCFCLMFYAFCLSALAQGTTFTYQGQLKDGGSPANGIYDLRFTIYDSTNFPGVIVAGPLTNSAAGLSNGLFTVRLDFGGDVFPGAGRWLEIGVRTNGGGPFAVLNPRQAMTPTPYAITAGNLSGVVSNASLAGTYSSPITLSNIANNFSGNGAGLTALNASQLTNGVVPSAALSNAWRISGNAGTTAGTHFVGTTDNQPVEIKVNNLRALRLENNGDSGDPGSVPDGAPNLIGGSPGNVVAPGVVGAVIGGGATNYSGLPRINSVSSDFGIIVGGGGNTIAGGSQASTIVNGYFNSIRTNSPYSTVGGGSDHNIGANAPSSTIAGGGLNRVGTNSDASTVGGGFNNAIGDSSDGATIAGGQVHGIGTNSPFSSIGGGYRNTIAESASTTVAGGRENDVGTNAHYSAIGGGYNNNVERNAAQSTIAGGYENDIGFGAGSSTIGGGGDNNIGSGSAGATIAGGAWNHIASDAFRSSIGGGETNYIGVNALGATIAGGIQNQIGASAYFATIGGGTYNTALPSATYSMIPGGQYNVVASFSFAAGNGARANHTGAFVWNDSVGTLTTSSNGDSVTMRARGGYRFFSDGGTNGVSLAPGGGSWVNMSDRNAKENFTPIDGRVILDKVAALPLHAWNYRSQADSIRHLGPMAQDFRAAFGLGETDTGIATVDADGVALAAIQGLNEKVEVRSEKSEVRLQKLEAENADLKQKNQSLEQRLDALEKIILSRK